MCQLTPKSLSCAACRQAGRRAAWSASQYVTALQALMTLHAWHRTTTRPSSTSRPTSPICTSTATLSTHSRVSARLPSPAHHLHAMPCSQECSESKASRQCPLRLMSPLRALWPEECVVLPICAPCGFERLRWWWMSIIGCMHCGGGPQVGRLLFSQTSLASQRTSIS